MGRFVFVERHMYSECWSLLNIYAPKFNDPALIQNSCLFTARASGVLLMEAISIFFWTQFLIDPLMNHFLFTKGSKLTNYFMKDYNLTDVGDRDYSFIHTLMVLLSNNQCQRGLDLRYPSLLLSDKSPLVLSISMPNKIKHPIDRALTLCSWSNQTFSP